MYDSIPPSLLRAIVHILSGDRTSSPLFVMSNSTTVGWTSEPAARGTLGLVWGCLATIFICTWSALHLNLPAEEDGAWTRAVNQAQYTVAGLLAPEWFAFNAFNDLELAIEIRRRVSHCFGNRYLLVI